MTEKKEQTTASLLVSFVLMLAISGYIINMAVSSDNFRVDYELYQHGKIASGKVKSVVRSFETPRDGKEPYHPFTSLADVLIQPTTALYLGFGVFAAFSTFFMLLKGLFMQIRAKRARENQVL